MQSETRPRRSCVCPADPVLTKGTFPQVNTHTLCRDCRAPCRPCHSPGKPPRSRLHTSTMSQNDTRQCSLVSMVARLKIRLLAPYFWHWTPVVRGGPGTARIQIRLGGCMRIGGRDGWLWSAGALCCRRTRLAGLDHRARQASTGRLSSRAGPGPLVFKSGWPLRALQKGLPSVAPVLVLERPIGFEPTTFSLGS
jgi:hypothetical protein